MMNSTIERNKKAAEIVQTYIENSKKNYFSPDKLEIYREEILLLKDLIPIKTKGFRGVVLTAIIGKKIDFNLNPTNDFYQCNPRSIYEKGIYQILKSNKIPCGKSDPLNVAKNISKLDLEWAKGKRPESAAIAAVKFLRILEENWHKTSKREDLIRLFFIELLTYRDLVDSKNKKFIPTTNNFSLEFAERLSSFATNCPEGGEVPQYIVGLLILLLRENDTSYKEVKGVDESVFGTNTTSKKPSDIWEINSYDSYENLYEITVKNIDEKRLEDCANSLLGNKVYTKEITFICRIPEDINDLNLKHNFLNYEGINFQFIDIRNFIKNTYILLSELQKKNFIILFENFIFDPNRSIKTKEYWGNINQS